MVSSCDARPDGSLRPILPAAALLTLAMGLSEAAFCQADDAGVPTPESNANTADDATLSLRIRRQVRLDDARRPGFRSQTTTHAWPAGETAIVICDMWDDHWCEAAADRVAEFAPRLNRMIAHARERGVLIIHCPSSVTDFYSGTPARERAREAKRIAFDTGEVLRPDPKPWVFLDPDREPPLPVSADEGDAVCESGDEVDYVWTRQIDAIAIDDRDAVTDNDEALYLMRDRGIRHVLVTGVHLNMCVLGRPFGIRQLVERGYDVALVRDLTDGLYDPAESPFVSHFDGNRLLIQHIERHWCGSTTSGDIDGEPVFRFKADWSPPDTPQTATDD